MRIYISGPMTGIPNFNRSAFKEAEIVLTAMGHEVFNPGNNPPDGTRRTVPGSRSSLDLPQGGRDRDAVRLGPLNRRRRGTGYGQSPRDSSLVSGYLGPRQVHKLPQD